jgi:hypothetical protein
MVYGVVPLLLLAGPLVVRGMETCVIPGPVRRWSNVRSRSNQTRCLKVLCLVLVISDNA